MGAGMLEEGTGGEIVAEFSEVIKQFKRMCKSVTLAKCTRGECPMGCENIGQCRKVAFERPSDFEQRVMSWAAEHPEPVYPTWVEWLREIGIVPSEQKCFHDWLLASIPADIAQKLGIEPKEEP